MKKLHAFVTVVHAITQSEKSPDKVQCTFGISTDAAMRWYTICWHSGGQLLAHLAEFIKTWFAMLVFLVCMLDNDGLLVEPKKVT